MKKIESSKAKNNSLEKILENDSIATLANPQKSPKKSFKIGNLIQYTPATFLRRFSARLIDSIFLGLFTLFVFFIAISIFVSRQNSDLIQYVVDNCATSQQITSDPTCEKYFKENVSYLNTSLIIGYAINVLYFVIMPITKLQATFGKKILSLKVINKDTLGQINLLQSFTREVFWIFSTITLILKIIFLSNNNFVNTIDQIAFFLILISCTQIIVDQNKQAWHDKLANTLVAREIKKTQSKKTINTKSQ